MTITKVLKCGKSPIKARDCSNALRVTCACLKLRNQFSIILFLLCNQLWNFNHNDVAQQEGQPAQYCNMSTLFVV